MTKFEENGFIYTVISNTNTVGLGDSSNQNTAGNAIPSGTTCPENVVIPPTIQNGKYKVTSILQSALQHRKIYSIKLPHTLTIIKYCGLADLVNVSELIIPASVEVLETYAISGYISCKRLIFAAGSKLREIKYGAFNGHKAKSIIIPSSVTTFEKHNFQNWKNLKKIYVCMLSAVGDIAEFWDKTPSDIKIYVTNGYPSTTFSGKPVEVIDSCGYFSNYYGRVCSLNNLSEYSAYIDIFYLLLFNFFNLE